MDLAATLTDDRMMAALLQRTLPGCREGAWDIERCRVVRSRRRVSRRAETLGSPWLGVCYRLDARDASSGRADVQWLYAKAYSKGRSRDAFRDAAPQQCVVPPVGEPVVHVPELDLVVWSLPNEPALAHLPAFLDGAAVRPHLPLERLYLKPAHDVRLAAPEIVRHEPEKHCTARFTLQRHGRMDAIYGRSYAGEAWRDARDCVDALWRQACTDQRAFLVGRPLGTSAALNAVWQEGVTGHPFALELAGADRETALDALAAALLRLHADGPIAGRRGLLGATVDTARRWRQRLIRADARFAPRLDALLLRLEREAVEPRRQVPIHGDFHAGQLAWCDGRVALFDYDHFALGAPARDLADFAAALLCCDDGPTDWAGAAAGLVERYRAACGDEPADDELDWHLRLMLLRRAYQTFIRHRAGWREGVARALAAADAGLAALPIRRGAPR